MAKRGEIDPWNVDIVELTDRFLQRIDDIRVSGRVILYASILLRMKAEILLNEIFGDEEENTDLDFEDFEVVDVDIELDVKPVKRRIKRFTTLDELVKELRRIEKLQERRKKRMKVRKIFASFENVPHEENIEEKIVEVYKDLLKLGKQELSFFNLVKGFDKGKKLMYYVSLLHLAFRRKLELKQDRLYDDIRVILNEEGG